MRIDSKKYKGLFIILVGILFFLSMGITYAYFSLGIRGNENATITEAKMGTLKIVYEETNNIVATNIEPSWSDSKTITVTNTGTLPVSYSLLWSNLINEIENHELIMGLECTSSTGDCSNKNFEVEVNEYEEEGIIYYDYFDPMLGGFNSLSKVPASGTNIPIQKGFIINPDEEQTITLTFYFKELSRPQDYNQGKIFSGLLKVEEYDGSYTLSHDWKKIAGLEEIVTDCYDMDDDGDVEEDECEKYLDATLAGQSVQSIYFYNDVPLNENMSSIINDKNYNVHFLGTNIRDGEVTDVSEMHDGSVLLYKTPNGNIITDYGYYDYETGEGKTTDLVMYDISIVSDGTIKFPFDSSYLMSYLYNSESINFIDEVNISKAVTMSGMFRGAGYSSTTFELDLSNWDTSSVTDMSYMFDNAGFYATTFELDSSNWNTSSVTDMSGMFFETGDVATTFELDLSNWNTSSVTDMSGMFDSAGENATTWNIGNLSNWNTSSVTDMSGMFGSAGYNATTWNIGNLNNWDTSNVTDMSRMFQGAGVNATTFELDLSDWDTSSVTDMSGMFLNAGYNATTFELDLSNWETSNVTDMSAMFYQAGFSATTYKIGDLSNWDTSSVTDMTQMFENAGRNATTFELDLSNWDTSSVTNMDSMFYGTGQNVTTWDIGDISNWDTSSVTIIKGLFGDSGVKNIDLSGWDVSNVTDLTGIFYNCNKLISVDLSGWDVSNVSETSGRSVGHTGGYASSYGTFEESNKLTTIYVSDSWDLSGATHTANLFKGCTSLVGGNGTTYSSSHIDKEYARIDSAGAPGYLTRK